MNELAIDLRGLAVQTIRLIPGKAKRFEIVFVNTVRDMRLVLTLPGDSAAALATLLRTLDTTDDFLLTGYAMRSFADPLEAASVLDGDVHEMMKWSNDARSVRRNDKAADDHHTACVTHES